MAHKIAQRKIQLKTLFGFLVLIATCLSSCERKPGLFDARTMKEQWVGAKFEVTPKLAPRPAGESQTAECKYESKIQFIPSYDYDMSEFCGTN